MRKSGDLDLENALDRADDLRHVGIGDAPLRNGFRPVTHRADPLRVRMMTFGAAVHLEDVVIRSDVAAAKSRHEGDDFWKEPEDDAGMVGFVYADASVMLIGLVAGADAADILT